MQLLYYYYVYKYFLFLLFDKICKIYKWGNIAAIYGGFARNCVAKTMEDNLENEYIVTDENGCATDPTIFGEWEQNPDTQSLMASFNAFKFPSSDNIRFQCNIRVCFGRCQPVSIRACEFIIQLQSFQVCAN